MHTTQYTVEARALLAKMHKQLFDLGIPMSMVSFESGISRSQIYRSFKGDNIPSLDSYLAMKAAVAKLVKRETDRISKELNEAP